MAQCLDKRLVRECGCLLAASEQDRRSLRVGGEGELSGQTRLADAGLPCEQDQLTLPGPYPLPVLLKPFQLPLAANEGRPLTAGKQRRQREGRRPLNARREGPRQLLREGFPDHFVGCERLSGALQRERSQVAEGIPAARANKTAYQV